MSNRKAKHVVHVRRSKVDGKFRRWELRLASDIGLIDLVDNQGPCGPLPQPAVIDGLRWVATGVFNTRREALA